MDSVLVCYRSYRAAWITNSQHSGWDGFGHHTSGTDDSPFADLHTGQDDYIGSDPGMVSDLYGAGRHQSFLALIFLQGMGYGNQRAVGAYHDMISNRHFGFIQNAQIEIPDEVISNPDIKSEVAAERTVNHTVFTELSEQVLESLPALLFAGWAHIVDVETGIGTAGQHVADLR